MEGNRWEHVSNVHNSGKNVNTMKELCCVNVHYIFMSQGSYEPGKRHWLKVKKDYLNEGAMADTADLVVLGAFYGKGSNGL